MNKIISFSLWGNSKIYCEGAKENVITAKKYLPDYKCRFYIAEDCPVLPELSKIDCELIIMPPAEGVSRDDGCKWHKNQNLFRMMDRFLAFGDNLDFIISRDADSRINPRDAACVREWERSGYLAHQISENQLHYTNGPMGGMVGVVGGLFPNIRDFINEYLNKFYLWNEPPVFSDIIFLRDVLFPHIGFSILRHGFGGIPIPSHDPIPEGLGKFVGDVVDEHLRNEVYDEG